METLAAAVTFEGELDRAGGRCCMAVRQPLIVSLKLECYVGGPHIDRNLIAPVTVHVADVNARVKVSASLYLK
jgi:hypothetical protein